MEVPDEQTNHHLMNNSTNGTDENNNNSISIQDKYLSVTNIVKIMRKILPANAKISGNAKETFQECVSEFINFITAEANERCQQYQRKTINADDIIWAMKKLGFDDYVQPLILYLYRYREIEGAARRSKKRSSEPLVRSIVTEQPSGYECYGPDFYMGHYPAFFGSGSVVSGLLTHSQGATSSSSRVHLANLESSSGMWDE